MPRELERACEAFRSYYLASHSGRKLSWQTNMGNAGVWAPCPAGGRQTLSCGGTADAPLRYVSELEPKVTVHDVHAVLTNTYGPAAAVVCKAQVMSLPWSDKWRPCKRRSSRV